MLLTVDRGNIRRSPQTSDIGPVIGAFFRTLQHAQRHSLLPGCVCVCAPIGDSRPGNAVAHSVFACIPACVRPCMVACFHVRRLFCLLGNAIVLARPCSQGHGAPRESAAAEVA